MYNIVLDRLPTEYEGYLIRSDFRIGIQISTCMSDFELSDDDRVLSALTLLYGRGIPNFEVAYSGLIWFLSCGAIKLTTEDILNPKKEDKGDKSDIEILSFEQDIVPIYSAFRKCYNIDLTHERMHWFEFNALLNDISDCVMTNIMNIRTMKMEDVDKKRRPELLSLKNKYYIKTKKDYEYEEAMTEFMRKMKQ